MFPLKMLDANILAEVQKMKGGKMDKSYARRTNEKLGELSGFFGFKLIIEGNKFGQLIDASFRPIFST